ESETRERARRGGTHEEDGDGVTTSDTRRFRAVTSGDEEIQNPARDEGRRALTHQQAEAEQGPAGAQDDRSPLAGGSRQDEGSRDEWEQREVLGVGSDAERLGIERQRGEQSGGGDTHSGSAQTGAGQIGGHRGRRGDQDGAGANPRGRLSERGH